jgi:hydroxyacylglutathione hydrolase
LLVEIPVHKELSSAQFLQATNDGVKVIDTRSKVEFAKGFILGSINIQHNNSLSTWAGWILNYQEQFIIVADASEIEEITRKLMRIGLDNIYGFVTNVEELPIELQTADVIDLETFKSYINRDDVQVVDVRGLNEYSDGHVKGAEHVFVGTLQDNLEKISKDKQVVIHCQSGDRATIAHSILRRNGFDQVKTYSGGMKEWLANGGETTARG